MRTQQGASSPVKRRRTPLEKQERQVKILESKARARRWAERNRIRNNPIAVAQEMTVKPPQAASRPHSRDALRIVEDLLKRKTPPPHRTGRNRNSPHCHLAYVMKLSFKSLMGSIPKGGQTADQVIAAGVTVRKKDRPSLSTSDKLKLSRAAREGGTDKV